MLHVLPAGTYGLRPAVNRSNTRTLCGTVCTGGGRVHRDAMQAVYRFQPLGSPLVRLPTLVAILSPPLFAGTTSPSDYLHLVPRVPSAVPSASHPDAFNVCDRFLNLCGLSPSIIAAQSSRKSWRDWCFDAPHHFDKPVRYFGFWPVASLPASFVLHRRAISAEFRSLAWKAINRLYDTI